MCVKYRERLLLVVLPSALPVNSEARPVCLCSQPALKTDCGRYKACVAALSFARQPVCPVLAGRYVNGVVEVAFSDASGRSCACTAYGDRVVAVGSAGSWPPLLACGIQHGARCATLKTGPRTDNAFALSACTQFTGITGFFCARPDESDSMHRVTPSSGPTARQAALVSAQACYRLL